MTAGLLIFMLILTCCPNLVLAEEPVAEPGSVVETPKESGQTNAKGEVIESQEDLQFDVKTESSVKTGEGINGTDNPEAAVDMQQMKEGTIIFVNASGNDESGDGTQEQPYASLRKAVEEANKSAEKDITIQLQSPITITRCARIVDKNVTINGNGHTVTRGDNFERISDNARSWYNPAMLEVTTPNETGASVYLENIVFDDAGKHMGNIYKQVDGKDTENVVQDAIIAAYGTGKASANIILGKGTVLKDFGGMSAVRVTGGASLIMESGSKIYDESVMDRVKGDNGSVGPAGAVWVQGTKIVMNAGAEISNMVGRAFYIDGGNAEIGGSIINIKADDHMWQGKTGIGVHARGGSKAILTATCRISSFEGNATGDVLGIYASDLDMKQGAEISDITKLTAVYVDDIGNDYQHKALINGVVRNITNDSIMRSWYGHIEIGSTGIVKDCKSSYGLYTNNGSRYTINGSVLNISGTALYLANQSGGHVTAEMNDGAVISGAGMAVRVNNGSLFTMNGGTIENNTTGVQVSGKTNFKGVEFVMNGGTIQNNNSGISYTIAGESKVALRGGSIVNNGTSYQIFTSGGSAKNANENIVIKNGVLQGNTSVYLSAGTVTLDPQYRSVSLGKASETAKDKIEELIKKEHPKWKLVGTSALWIRPEAESYHFQLKVTSKDTSGLYVAYIPLKEDGTPEDNAKLELKEVKNEPVVDISMENLDSGKAYGLMLVNNDRYTISPDDITIYTGGNEYNDTHGLPEDYTLDGINKITSIKVGDKETTYKSYPATEQEKAREDLKALFTMTYIDQNGQELTTDKKAGEYIEDFQLNEGKLEDIKVNGNDVSIEDGTLLIRYTSDIEEAVSGTSVKELLVAEPTEIITEHAIGVATANSKYYINDDDGREIIDSSGIALLDDTLLTSEKDNRVELLQKRADEIVKWDNQETIEARNYYDFHYLDLVDKNNGNAWVSSSNGTIVYLPYPEGTNQETTFRLVHYQDLHREYGITGQENVEQAIKETRVELIKHTNEIAGIKFEIPRSGFSPFALVWQGQNEAPVIYADDKVLTVGDKFDPLEGVTAYDEGDGDLTNQVQVIQNTVNTNMVGEYEVTYQVQDKQGKLATKTICVKVVNKEAGTFSKKDTGNAGKVKTGDTGKIVFWMWILLVSMSMVVSTKVYQKRKNR